MSLKLMYITNVPHVAKEAEAAGVDRLFVDMEYLGKELRQGGMDTVQSRHTVDDVRRIKSVLTTAQLLVRCNPVGDRPAASIASEIDDIVAAGADIIMLPYYKTLPEVTTFLDAVNGRVKTCLLLETPEAADIVDEVLALDGVDEMFIGLNDLSLGMGKSFMFELLADGTVERLCECFRRQGKSFGFGGVASLGKGILPSEKIIAEHYRLGSGSVILSRSFCDVNRLPEGADIRSIFQHGVGQIREYEVFCQAQSDEFFRNNIADVKRIVGSL